MRNQLNFRFGIADCGLTRPVTGPRGNGHTLVGEQASKLVGSKAGKLAGVQAAAYIRKCVLAYGVYEKGGSAYRLSANLRALSTSAMRVGGTAPARFGRWVLGSKKRAGSKERI
jgi:hypothetical protein